MLSSLDHSNNVTNNTPSLSPLTEVKVFHTYHLAFLHGRKNGSCFLRWTFILTVGASAVCLHMNLGEDSILAGKIQLTLLFI